MPLRKLPTYALLTLALVTLAASGCATKKYVRQRIDERVTPLENRTGELEETARRNSADINRLNTEVADARDRADRAQTTADKAQVAAVDAASRADRVNTRVDEVVETIENIDQYSLQKTVTVTFRLNRDVLDEEALAALDALAAEFQGKKGFVFDIQGYTDTSGALKKNMALSDRRARAVYQYLAERGIPLFRMNLLGFGEGQPAADNTTAEGRAQNRRVEVRVMVSNAHD